MGVLWGFIMFFICHTVFTVFACNLYCYIQEEKCEDKNQYAMKKYLITFLIALAIYIFMLVIALLVSPFADHKGGVLIGNGIGFITGSIHFRLIAEANYNKQKAKNDWNSWNYMSFEEKRKALNQISTPTPTEQAHSGFLKNGHYNISQFIKEEQLHGRLEDIEVVIGESNISRYNKNDNNIYIGDKDNQSNESFINALLRCFQQAICVDSGILYSQTSYGKNDTEVSDEDLFDDLDESTIDFTKKLRDLERWSHDMTANMTLERFFDIQHDLPGFGFPLDDEKIDPEGKFRKIEEKQNQGLPLTSEEHSKLIFADIFASWGHAVNLNKAESASKKFLSDINNAKPQDLSDKAVYLEWFKQWQMAQVLLGTVYAYKKDYTKAAYHLMLGFDGGLMMGTLTLKKPYEGFIKYVFDQLMYFTAEKANYTGCGFSVDNPMGAYKQIGETSLWAPDAQFIISRMQGLNGEVIIYYRGGDSSMGYLERVGSCGQPQGLIGVVDKYRTLIIDKNYHIKTVEIFFNGYFEDAEEKFKRDRYGETKNNCKIPNGFTIKRTCLDDLRFIYVDTNGKPLKAVSNE